MNKLIKTGLVALLFACSAFSSASDLDVLVEKMILEGSSDVKKIGAKTVHENPDRTQKVGDALAYLLVDGVEKNNNYDLTAWAAKSLGALNNPRYLQVLNDSLANSKSDKISKYIKIALGQVTKGSADGVESFDVSQYNRDAALADLSARYVIKDNVGDVWGEISIGNTIDETLAVFGMPYIIDEEINDKRHPYAGRIRTQRLALRYEDIGYVTFGSNGGRLTVETISASYEGLPNASDSKDAALIHTILTGSSTEFRLAARNVCDQGKYTQDVLDASAHRAWSERNSTGTAADGVAWLMKCIGYSSNARYRTILGDIKKVSKVRKIRNYAASALKSLDRKSVEQFSIEGNAKEDK